MTAVEEIVWCTSCGRHMRVSLALDGLVCPAGCGTIITSEALDRLDDLLERERPFRDWLNAALRRYAQRAVYGSIDDLLWGSGTGRPMGVLRYDGAMPPMLGLWQHRPMALDVITGV